MITKPHFIIWSESALFNVSRILRLSKMIYAPTTAEASLKNSVFHQAKPSTKKNTVSASKIDFIRSAGAGSLDLHPSTVHSLMPHTVNAFHPRLLTSSAMASFYMAAVMIRE
uniref:Uncharacterized protein n=1 Tax=Glossina palpalis gambiensis TaxID=67801 RepID=A0A1B0BQW6_9MUSC